MRTNKKARPDTAIPERERMGAETGQDTTSTINDTTPTPSGQAVKIADLLGHGQNAAVPLRNPKELAGLPGREVRRMIEAERRAGALIISDNAHGYYLTDDPAEAQRFAQSMRHRAGQIIKTARAVKEVAGLD